MSDHRQSKIEHTRRRARPIHDRQVHTILGLANDLSWSQSIFARYLHRFHACASINAIRTARKAEAIILDLLDRKRHRLKQHTRRGDTTPTPSGSTW